VKKKTFFFFPVHLPHTRTPPERESERMGGQTSTPRLSIDAQARDSKLAHDIFRSEETMTAFAASYIQDVSESATRNVHNYREGRYISLSSLDPDEQW